MPVSVPDKLELNDAYVQHAGVTGMRVCTAWRGSDALASGDAVNSWGARVCAGGVSECVRSWEVMGGHGRSWEIMGGLQTQGSTRPEGFLGGSAQGLPLPAASKVS